MAVNSEDRCLIGTDDPCREQPAGESERSLRAILSASPIGIGRIRGDVFVWINEALCRMTGYPTDAFVGKDSRFLFESTEEHIRARDILRSANHVETSWKRNDGVMIDVLAQTAPIDEDSEIITVTDISYRAQVERDEARIGKLESLGVLAGGIAHDFNNILTMILGNVTLGKMYLDRDVQKSREKLTLAEDAVTRAKDLTQQLLTFSRGGAPITKISSIGERLRETARFVLTGTAVDCTFDIADGLSAVAIDEGQMDQAIGNILINASQAMPSGGIIHICACDMIMGKEAPNLDPGRYVHISITDTGLGIPEDHIDRVFDPYFTTKQKGSGLGLAICYSIIKNHKGAITADSVIGVGSTFHIYLPACDMPDQRSEKDMSDAVGGSILVMDDEEAIRDIVGDILAYHGFTVDFASDGEEALAMYQEKAYDAVILDLTVPGGMGGKETIKELLRMDPGVRAIVSSGYSNDPIMSEYRNYGFKDVIAKPYNLDDLGNVLRSVISGD